MVTFDCGHLVLCRQCFDRMEKKKYKKCLVCSSAIRVQKKLLASAEGEYGFRTGKLFLEKKLHRNQFLIEE